MTVAAPSVSTAGSLRTIAPRLAMRCMPSASVMVVIAGRPSGIAATARLTASSSSSCQARPPFTHAPGEEQHADAEAGPEDALAEAVEPLLERRLLVRARWRSARRSGRARFRAGGDDDRAALAAHHRGAEEDHGAAVAERRVVGERAARVFHGRRALAGERRLFRGEVDRLHEARVGGNGVARLELEDVAGHELVRR